jgi:hypothetical protein
MISIEDCIGLCGLSEAEVAAVAEHEHLPEIAAAILARYILANKEGPEKIRDILIDDIRAASAAGDGRHAAELISALRHFLSTHPIRAAGATQATEASPPEIQA